MRAKRLPVARRVPLAADGAGRRAVPRAVVEQVEFREPRVPVLSCVTAAPFDDVPEQLVHALTDPVRWPA